ncbi:dihydrofolate reductase family protein [Thermocatellispora tengchongensis]|uniref:dihydrofolate reductase family protein n=1 Tax=Thermocatellispora tengchongensis TaxID=1073253 RepID=UPI00363BC541
MDAAVGGRVHLRAAGEFDWPVFEAEMTRYADEQTGTLGMFLYGRKVYEGMASYWPTADRQPGAHPHDLAFARVWREKPKAVFSSTLEHAGWNTTIVSTDLPKAVAELKERSEGDLGLFGGAEITAEFIRLGLIDEYRIFVHPVVLGGGIPLFAPGLERTPLRLVEARTLDSAVVLHRYASAAS